jgi:cytidylate kinase
MERTPRSVDAIVEAQVQRWLAQRARSSPPAEPAPVITISREYGARGAAVARVVADRTGFSFWDRELLDAIAANAHLDPIVLAPFDEHHRSVLIDTVGGMIPRATSPSQADYVRALHAVAKELVLRGGAVMIGRGLHLLIGAAHALRVRVVCPLEQRIRELADREHIDTDTARTAIEDADRDRRAFVRDLYGAEVDDPSAYDLWLNTGTLSLDGAAAMVVAAYRHRFGERALRATV